MLNCFFFSGNYFKASKKLKKVIGQPYFSWKTRKKAPGQYEALST